MKTEDHIVNAHNFMADCSALIDRGSDMLAAEAMYGAVVQAIHALGHLQKEQHPQNKKGLNKVINDGIDNKVITDAIKQRHLLNLTPGWNPVSLPQEAPDIGIGMIFTESIEVRTVYSYDPVEMEWHVAVREETNDAWMGDLTDISVGRDYLVLSDSTHDIEVYIPRNYLDVLQHDVLGLHNHFYTGRLNPENFDKKVETVREFVNHLLAKVEQVIGSNKADDGRNE